MRTMLLLLFVTISVKAQKDTIQLKEVIVNGSFSKKYHSGFQVQVLQDSLFQTATNLQDVLQEQANIYFKEYGNGMVSSISMRGTGAQHTAVYFNGIEINSALNGQTDFNTINPSDFNRITIKKGAGSTTLGSGAIGGAINLEDIIEYKKNNKFQFSGSLGSYQTQTARVQYQRANKQFYSKFAISGDKSENDYPYLNTDQKNENGAYKRYFVKSVLGYHISNNSELQFFGTFSKNHRDLSGSLSATSNSNLQDENVRLLMRYKLQQNRSKHQIDVAFLHEKYRFYLYKNSDDFSFGKANTSIVKYKFTYFISNKIQLFSGVDAKQIFTKGSAIEKQQNSQSEIFVLTHFKPTAKWQGNLSFRKGIATNFSIPFIYSADFSCRFRKNFTFKSNVSTNYRLPTVNDLYWSPGGYPNLKSESNLSYETTIEYDSNKCDFGFTWYHIKSKNLIQWQPVSGDFWQPINVQQVNATGFEFDGKWNFKNIQLHFIYDYTKSVDESNQKQLIYVPYHKATASVFYPLKKWQFYLNAQYNGKIYTTTTNTQIVPAYTLLNFKLNRKIPKFDANIGLKINNLLNTYYEVVAYRPMPNRNFSIYFTIQF